MCDGAHSLGELDLAGLCRAHGLPEPARQVLRRLPSGAAYLDVHWPEAGLTVEIDGSGHRVGLAVSSDNLRQDELALQEDIVLRIDLVGMRGLEAHVIDQVRRAHAEGLRRRRDGGGPRP